MNPAHLMCLANSSPITRPTLLLRQTVMRYFHFRRSPSALYVCAKSWPACVLVAALLLSAIGLDANGDDAAHANRMVGRRFVLNQDSRDICFIAPQENVQTWLRDWYRRAFSAGVDVFVAEVVHPDISVVKDLPTAELIGSHLDPAQMAKLEKRYPTIKQLMDQNTDLLHVACEEGHQAQALVLAGMRMSDAHHGARWKPSSESHSSKFICDHPEWCNTWEDGTRDATLNYAVPEVRAHRLQILRELATNYDIDGIEIDWTRHGRHFPSERQKEHAPILTEYVHQIRAMLDEVSQKKGKPRMILGHRVTTTIEECLNVGCDVQAWIRNGDADFLATMDFLHFDPNMPVEEFTEVAKGTTCQVYAGFGSVRYSLGDRYQPRDGSKRRTALLSTADQFRAAAANWFAWGANGGSSYNMIAWSADSQPFYRDAVAIMSDAEKAFAGPRHYVFLPTWKDHLTMSVRMKRYATASTDWTLERGPGKPVRLSMGYMQAPGAREIGQGTSPTGRFNSQCLEFSADDVGHRQTFHFRMADGRHGEALSGRLRLRIYGATPLDQFQIDLNGMLLPSDRIRIEYHPEGESAGRVNAPPPDDGTIDFPANLRLEIDLADCPRFRGDNHLGITLTAKNPESSQRLEMEAVEIYVR